jgi:hypothetical protein
VLRAIAIDTTIKETGLAAVEKLDDVERLENVANKAKNKAVRQRARKIVQEITASEKAKQKSTVPDDVKRRRAEKAQLVRELEGLADTFDFAKASVTVKAAQEAWAKLEGADEGDERFTKAVERFWKRKEIHEQQARSADELRAIEREAQRRAARCQLQLLGQHRARQVQFCEVELRRLGRELQLMHEEQVRTQPAAGRDARAR